MPFNTLNNKYISTKYRYKIAELSRYFGQYSIESDGFQNIFLGGGNSSINDGDTLWVKLSGTSFTNIKQGDFGELNILKLLKGMNEIASLCDKVLKEDYTSNFEPVMELDRYTSSLFTKINLRKGEPSVEAGLHAVLIGTKTRPRWNMHDHNTIVNSLLCSMNAENAFDDIFGSNNKKIRYLKFVEPGAPLFLFFKERIEEWGKEEKVEVILLSQHGKIQTGESREEVIRLHEDIIDKVNQYIEENIPREIFRVDNKPKINIGIMEEVKEYIEEIFPDMWVENIKIDDIIVENVLCSEYALDKLSKGMPNPDAAVYGNAATMNIDYYWEKSNIKDKIFEAKARYQNIFNPININNEPYIPKIIIIPKAGIITMGRNRKVAENAYTALLDTVYIMRGAEAFGGMKPLSMKHLFFLNNWAAEKRREKRAS